MGTAITGRRNMTNQTELEIKELVGQKRPVCAIGKDRTDMIAKVGAILTDWESGCGDDPDNLIEMAKDVIAHYDDDGYALAKMLEDEHGLDPDVSLVDALEDVTGIKHMATRATVERWVRDNEIVCPFEVGAKVMTRGVEGPGEIYEIDAKQAQCSVRFECLGHVAKGMGTHGRILKYEDLEAVP